MQGSEKIRLATVGTGYFSRFHYAAWARIPEVELLGVCSVDNDSMSDVVDQYDVAFSNNNFTAMLDEVKPDLVDIITPPDTHTEFVMACVERGITVICQKPFTQNYQQAKALVEQIKAHNGQVIIHENFRFQPWYIKLKSLLEQNVLGQLYQVTFSLRPGDGQGPQAYLERQPYFQQMERFLIHETAIHFIDVFRYLFGEMTSVFADLRRINPVIKGEDAGLLVFNFENGTRGLLDGNRLSDHNAKNCRLTMGEMRIEGEKGVLSLSGDGKISFRICGDTQMLNIAYEWLDCDFGGDSVYNLQRYVIDQLMQGAYVVNNAQDYLQNLKIAELAYQSNASRKALDCNHDEVS